MVKQKQTEEKKKESKRDKVGSLAAVDPAQITVPADGHDIGKEDTVLEGQEGKVDGLHKRPNHPVGAEGRPPHLLEALRGTGTLHGGHAAQKGANGDGRKQALVNDDAGGCLDTLVGKGDTTGEEVEPGSGSRTKNDFIFVKLDVSK